MGDFRQFLRLVYLQLMGKPNYRCHEEEQNDRDGEHTYLMIQFARSSSWFLQEAIRVQIRDPINRAKDDNEHGRKEDKHHHIKAMDQNDGKHGTKFEHRVEEHIELGDQHNEKYHNPDDKCHKRQKRAQTFNDGL